MPKLSAMDTTARQTPVIEPYCEERDLAEIQDIMDKCSVLRELSGRPANDADFGLQLQPKSPPLTTILKNDRSEKLFERLNLRTLTTSYTSVLRLKNRTVGFVCYSSLIKAPIASQHATRPEASGTITLIGLHPEQDKVTFKNIGLKELLLRYAIERLRHESVVDTIETFIKIGHDTMQALYSKLNFRSIPCDHPGEYFLYTLSTKDYPDSRK